MQNKRLQNELIPAWTYYKDTQHLIKQSINLTKKQTVIFLMIIQRLEEPSNYSEKSMKKHLQPITSI